MINNIIIFATEIVGSSYPMIRKFPNLLSPSSTTIWDEIEEMGERDDREYDRMYNKERERDDRYWDENERMGERRGRRRRYR